MATLDLTINPDYVPDWGVWEAVRELIQNALDAHDQGYTMDITRDDKTGTVSIINRGATLHRSSLLLGSSSKRDDPGQRGQFGEGYKLAMLTLTRMDRPVLAHIHGETWTPSIVHSDMFDSKVLRIDVQPAQYDNDAVAFAVSGVTDEEWTIINDRCLMLSPPYDDEVIHTNAGRILLDEDTRGALYVKGLFVSHIDRFVYGYDVNELDLDRDRKLAHPIDLSYAVAGTLRDAVTSAKLSPETVMNLINTDAGEAGAMLGYYRYRDSGSDLAAKMISGAFTNKHGEDARPVADTDEASQLSVLGYKPIVVKDALRKVIETDTGKISEQAIARKMASKTTYAMSDLSDTEVINLEWCLTLIHPAESDVPEVKVVDFYGDDMIGTYTPGDPPVIRVSRKIMTDRFALLGTLAHEVAHKYGNDLTSEHAEGITRILTTIIMRLIGDIK